MYFFFKFRHGRPQQYVITSIVLSVLLLIYDLFINGKNYLKSGTRHYFVNCFHFKHLTPKLKVLEIITDATIPTQICKNIEKVSKNFKIIK